MWEKCSAQYDKGREMRLSYQPCLCSTTSGAREAWLKQRKIPLEMKLLDSYSALQPFLPTLQTCISLAALEKMCTHTVELLKNKVLFSVKMMLIRKASLACCMEATQSSKAHDVTTLESKMDFVFLNNLLRGAYTYGQTYSYMNRQKHTQRCF